MGRTKEFKRAIGRSSKYILSHHEEDQLNRCYSLNLSSKTLNFCSRCTGIYPGLLIGYLLLTHFRPLTAPEIFLSGIPTVIEKYYSSIENRFSSNFLRTSTGVLLGTGFVNGVFSATANPLNPDLIAVSIFYFFCVIVLLRLESKHP